ncbi:hypothetical protein OHA72_05745 [Dactylosporangium sp. NBC_01737]|uniref:hypothetical protein n=1 Tax=Dactylosporangium sp. NBC_01737 TaxID=2975959 RepID=UPI002E14BAAC|nr:hypothetical protein OHA72_05745 [Dactylosporangium sp. NBC_01737]
MFRLRQRMVEEFTAWAVARAIVPGGAAGTEWRDRIEILLQCRADALDRADPTRWRSGDVHALFMDYVAPRQVDAWGLAERGLESVRDYLRFLDDTDRLHPGSARPAALFKELDRLEAKYPAAMADTDRWGLAKRIFTAMLRDGVRPDGDPAEVDAWAARFSARGPEERREVLGRMMEEQQGYATGTVLVNDGQVAMVSGGRKPVKHLIWPDLPCDCGCTAPVRFAPVTLPDDAALAKAVSTDGAALLHDLATLAGWVGSGGRAVDDRGEIRKADRPALLTALGRPVTKAGEPLLTTLWQMGIEFDVVQLRRTRVVPGRGADLVGAALAGTAPVRETLELWADLAEVLIHPVTPMHSEKGTEHLRSWLDPWTPLFLDLLHSAGGPGDLEALTDRLLDEQAGRLPGGDPELFAGIAGTAVRNILATLARHGAVAVTGVTEDPERAAVAAAYGTALWAMWPQPGLTVELTDLGRYLVHRRHLSEGTASIDSAAAGP